MKSVQSADGTTIAYDTVGQGPTLVMVVGALCDRSMAAPLAALLQESYTVVCYDRRGRGDSTDTEPYDVQREVEDLRAVVEAHGATASLFGHSSGALLALEAAAGGLPVQKLALYEPPLFDADGRLPEHPGPLLATLRALLAEGRPGDALEAWLLSTGADRDYVAATRTSPYWPTMEALAHTTTYDLTIVSGAQADAGLATRWASVEVPVLLVTGGDSPSGFQHSAKALVEWLPHAEGLSLAGQNHGYDPTVLAPVLLEFMARDRRPGQAVR